MLWLAFATLVLPALLAHLRGWRIGWHYGAVAVAGICLYGVVRAQTLVWALGGGSLDLHSSEQTYHDTYYVVANTQALATLGAAFLLPALVFNATHRTPDRRRDALLFWIILALTTLFALVPILMSWHLGLGRHYVASTDAFTTYNTANSALALGIAVTTLTTLTRTS